MLANLWSTAHNYLICNISQSHHHSHLWTLGPLDLEHFSFCLNVSQGVLINIFIFDRGFLLNRFILLVLIQERVFKISHWNAVSFEEPFFEFLDHVCLETCDVFIKLNYLIPYQLDLLKLQFIVSLAQLFLFDQLEFLLVNDVLGKFFRSLTVLFLVQFSRNFFKFFFLLLYVISFLLDCLFLQLQILNVLDDSIVELRTHIVLEFLIGLIFVNIDDLSFDLLLFLSVNWRALGLFLVFIFGNINQIWYISSWFSIFGGLPSPKAKILLLLANFSSGCFLIFSLTFLSFMQGFLSG